jgi:hypothetical protein
MNGEIALVPGLNVPYLHVLVAVGTLLLVPDPERMHEFVNDSVV